MRMTKRDYIRLADALSLARPSTADLFEQGIYARIVDRLCIVLLADNPAFNRATFVRACGL